VPPLRDGARGEPKAALSRISRSAVVSAAEKAETLHTRFAAAAVVHCGEPGVGAGLCARCDCCRAHDPGVEYRRWLHARVLGARGRYKLCRPTRDACVGIDHPARFAAADPPDLTSWYFLAWCLERKIVLVHIQPGKPVQNGRCQSFNGRLREECLRVSWFENLFDARRKIADWRKDYNEQRQPSSLDYQMPAKFAAATNCGKDAGCARLENPDRVSHVPTASTTARVVSTMRILGQVTL
jgi:putative transposase